jgi:hypothetical protein
VISVKTQLCGAKNTDAFQRAIRIIALHAQILSQRKILNASVAVSLHYGVMGTAGYAEIAGHGGRTK